MKTVKEKGIELVFFNGRDEYKKHLNFLPFNRPSDLSPSLVGSMKDHSILTSILIVVTTLIDGTKKMYIIDGQHRASAAAYLDIPFFAVMYSKTIQTKLDAVELVSMMHRTHKGWTIHNYVHAYATMGLKSYVDLYNIYQSNPYAISAIANIFGGFIGKSDLGTIRSGDYEIKSKGLAMETIEQANQLSKVMSGRMLVSFHKVRLLIDEFDFDKFKGNFESKYKELKATRYDDYFEVFKSYVQ